LKKCFEHVNRKYKTTPTDNVLKNPDLTREIAKYLRKKCGGKKGRNTRSNRQEGGAGKKNRCSVNPEANKMLLEGVHESCLNKIKNALVDRADINVKGTDGNTALHIAIEDGDIGIVDLLLKNGADIYIENKHEQNAINLATNYNRDIYDGPILTLIKEQDVKNKINEHLNDRCRRVDDRNNFANVVTGRIPDELVFEGLKYIGGKRKTRKSKKIV
jgi:methyl coenzyme M reductase subunit C-like uncharacterized protein (methanogenesis marker protein 7)